jgi:molecular chaperone GrpE (heat shock protein)
MVNLVFRLCELFSRKADDKDKEIAELNRLVKQLLPYAEPYLDHKAEIEELKRRLLADRLPLHMYQ